MIERQIPAGVQRELEKQESEEALLVFMTFNQQRLHEPLRVVSDPKNAILDGKEYQSFEFNINLLSDNDQAPRASLSILNTDSRISRGILETSEPVTIDIEIIALSEFDETQDKLVPRHEDVIRVYRARHLRLTDVTGNIIQLSGTIRSWDYFQETWPGLKATEDRFPALFWS